VHAQGYRFDKGKTQSILKDHVETKGFTGSLPPSYSMRKWAPTPDNQDGNSCVGWAMSYAAMSISYNKSLNITNEYMKDLLAFDPVFTYALGKIESDTNCEESIFFPIAIQQMLRYGCKRKIMPPLFLECNESVFEKTAEFAFPFTPEEIYAVNIEKAKTPAEKIKLIKTILAAGAPMPFGMDATQSMMGDGESNPITGGLWKPVGGDESMGGHAMCLIGYSDTRFGGAFEIMNSWGTEYGESGFFWIKYSDFINRVSELIYIEPITVRDGDCKIGDCSSLYSHLKLPERCSYEGMFENGIPEGYGIYCWQNQSFYAGMWKNGKRHGKGLFFKDNQVFFCIYNMNELLEMEPLGFASEPNSPQIEKVNVYLEKRKIKVQNTLPKEIINTLEEQSIPEKWN
jgi:hypothetical protein